MKRWHLIIDVEKCENCNNCFLACKDEHCGNDWADYSVSQPQHGQRWMNIRRKERGQFPNIDVAYRPTPCMHCDNAPCQRADRKGSVVKRPDGIVLIDPKKARGQKALVSSCPFGAIWWNAEKQVPQKCTMCAHLLDTGWSAPRCVQACPTGALSIHLLENEQLEHLTARQQLEALSHGKTPARPTVYYRNLHRFQKCFIAGSIAAGDETFSDCVAGATVRLYKEEEQVDNVVSDAFGDFKFDRLSPSSGSYRIEVDYQASAKKTIEVDLQESCSVGTVWI